MLPIWSILHMGVEMILLICNAICFKLLLFQLYIALILIADFNYSKHVNKTPMVFDETDESDTALSQLRPSSHSKSVVSFWRRVVLFLHCISDVIESFKTWTKGFKVIKYHGRFVVSHFNRDFLGNHAVLIVMSAGFRVWLKCISVIHMINGS